MPVHDHKLPIAASADDIELQAFANGRITFSDMVQQAIRSYPSDDREEYLTAELNEAVEIEVEGVWEEIERRESMMPRGYPFCLTTDGLVLREDWKSRGSYILCLILAAFQDRVSNDLRYDFEEATGTAVASIFNCDGWVRFGANRRKPIPGPIKDALDFVLPMVGEGGAHNPNFVYPRNGDLECDIIAWRSLVDDSSPYLVVVAGCATSEKWKAENKHKEDGRKKLRQASLSPWQSGIIRVFSTPFRNFSTTDLMDVANEEAFMLNRWRVAEYAVGALQGIRITRIEDYQEPAAQISLSWKGRRTHG